jgi:hypothetical protein
MNGLALTLAFVAAGGLYAMLCMRSKLVAVITSVGFLGSVCLVYSLIVGLVAVPPWSGWFLPHAEGEPMPGRPNIKISTKLDADWTVVGMNSEWMMLIAKTHLQMGQRPEAYMRWEYTDPKMNEEGDAYLSEVYWVELDCLKGSWNPLLVTSYAENNLAGGEIASVLGDRNEPVLDTPEPTSTLGAAVRKACGFFPK